MLKRLMRLADRDIDLSEQPEILKWSNAERGKFYRPVTQSQSSQTREKYEARAIDGAVSSGNIGSC